MKNFILLFFCLPSFLAFSQPEQNANIYFTKIAINPALAGQDNVPRFMAIGHNGNEYGKATIINYFISLEKSINNNMGVSIQHSNFKNSFAEKATTTLAINKKFSFSEKSSLAFGSSVGYAVSTYNIKNYINLLSSVGMPTSMFDVSTTSKFGSVAPESLKSNNFTLGAGLFLNTNSWSFGVSSPNVLKSEIPDITDLSKTIVLKRQIFFTTEKQSHISERWSLKSGILYSSKLTNKDVLYLNNSFWLKDKYGLGLWYKAIGNEKTTVPITVIAELIFDKIRFGYAYNFGKANTLNTDLTQQLMFRIDIDYLNKNKNIKNTETP